MPILILHHLFWFLALYPAQPVQGVKGPWLQTEQNADHVRSVSSHLEVLDNASSPWALPQQHHQQTIEDGGRDPLPVIRDQYYLTGDSSRSQRMEGERYNHQVQLHVGSPALQQGLTSDFEAQLAQFLYPSNPTLSDDNLATRTEASSSQQSPLDVPQGSGKSLIQLKENLEHQENPEAWGHNKLPLITSDQYHLKGHPSHPPLTQGGALEGFTYSNHQPLWPSHFESPAEHLTSGDFEDQLVRFLYPSTPNLSEFDMVSGEKQATPSQNFEHHKSPQEIPKWLEDFGSHSGENFELQQSMQDLGRDSLPLRTDQDNFKLHSSHSRLTNGREVKAQLMENNHQTDEVHQQSVSKFKSSARQGQQDLSDYEVSPSNPNLAEDDSLSIENQVAQYTLESSQPIKENFGYFGSQLRGKFGLSFSEQESHQETFNGIRKDQNTTRRKRIRTTEKLRGPRPTPKKLMDQLLVVKSSDLGRYPKNVSTLTTSYQKGQALKNPRNQLQERRGTPLHAELEKLAPSFRQFLSERISSFKTYIELTQPVEDLLRDVPIYYFTYYNKFFMKEFCQDPKVEEWRKIKRGMIGHSALLIQWRDSTQIKSTIQKLAKFVTYSSEIQTSQTVQNSFRERIEQLCIMTITTLRIVDIYAGAILQLKTDLAKNMKEIIEVMDAFWQGFKSFTEKGYSFNKEELISKLGLKLDFDLIQDFEIINQKFTSGMIIEGKMACVWRLVSVFIVKHYINGLSPFLGNNKNLPENFKSFIGDAIIYHACYENKSILK